MVAILSIVFMDATTPINCQVSLFSVFVYSRVFTRRDFKLWIVFERVSTLKGKRPLIDHRLFPQTFAYLSLAAASLLIVLRVYVLVHISAVRSSPRIWRLLGPSVLQFGTNIGSLWGWQ